MRESQFGGRQKARRLAFQALYAWLITQDEPQKIIRDFLLEVDATKKIDLSYFYRLLEEIPNQQEALEDLIKPHLQHRGVHEIDPTEHAILLLSAFELKHEPSIPYRVVINEALELAKTYGSVDGYKFINSIVDRAAKAERPHETAANSLN